MMKAFWRNKKVLITGHTGFKGSWLSLWLQLLGAKPIGYALEPPSNPSFFVDGEIASGMASITADVRDLQALENTMRAHQPDIVLHLAAQSLVRYSYDHPLDTYTTNIIGTAMVLEAVRKTKVSRAVLIVTSDKCYDNKEWIWGYRESDPFGGYDPYSSSKGCAELITSAYRNSYFPTAQYNDHGITVASARAGNVIGGGDWADDRLVPDIFKSILSKKRVNIRNPRAVRPWQFVLEPLYGYLSLAQKMYESGVEYSGGWNFGPDYTDCKPVDWIVEELSKAWGKQFKWSIDKKDNPHEANFLMLDCSKAKRRLKWKPLLDLKTALDWVNEWFICYSHNNKGVREIAEKQILRYMEMM